MDPVIVMREIEVGRFQPVRKKTGENATVVAFKMIDSAIDQGDRGKFRFAIDGIAYTVEATDAGRA